MASPGLKPVLFFLALDTAKPAGGYEAALWSNRAGPTLSPEHSNIFQSIFISTTLKGNRHSANVQLKYEEEGCCTATAQGHPNCPACVPLSVSRG